MNTDGPRYIWWDWHSLQGPRQSHGSQGRGHSHLVLKTVTRLACYRYDTIHPTDHPLDYAATVFTILEIFGLGNKVEALYGSEVNSLHNVITMVINLHSVFHSFNLWLELVLGQVCCIVCSVILHSSYMVYSGKHSWRLWETSWPVPSAHPITRHIHCPALCRSCSRGHE